MSEIYKNLYLNDIEEEIWLPIQDYEGLYAVSNMGRVKSLANDKSRKEKILRQGKLKTGYLVVVLCNDGKVKNCKVHRLVANAFIPNPNGYRCVNHKDENPSNNQVDNLEWCTYKYNVNYGTAQQRRVENIDWKAKVANTDYKAISRKNAEKLSRQVYQYDKNGELVAIWESTAECGRQGYNQGNVVSCCRGELKHYKKYIWSYTPIDSK